MDADINDSNRLPDEKLEKLCADSVKPLCDEIARRYNELRDHDVPEHTARHLVSVACYRLYHGSGIVTRRVESERVQAKATPRKP